MKKIITIILVLMLIFTSFVSAGVKRIDIQEYRGYQWTQLGLIEKIDIVGGVIAGFSMVRDFAFDLDPNMYDKYKAFDQWAAKNDVLLKIIETLNRYYELNKDSYKFKDRVTNMIIVIYSKYWWR